MDNLPLNPLSSFFILKQVKQEALHFIVKEVNYKSMTSRDNDFRFNMGKLQEVKVFLDIEVSVDDEESFDDTQEKCSIFPHMHMMLGVCTCVQCLI
jgi:adenylate cyclase class IV